MNTLECKMAKPETTTDQTPVAVRLSIGSWVLIIGSILAGVVVNTWMCSRFVSGLEQSSRDASSMAAAADKKADEAKADAKAVDARLNSMSSTLNDNLIKIASDLGEIKGQLKNIGTGGSK